MKKNTKQTKSATKPATVKKADKLTAPRTPKTTGKSPSASTKSVKTAVSTNQKPAKPVAKPAAKKCDSKTAATVAKQTTTNKASTSTTANGLITVNLKFHQDSNGGHHHIIVENLGDNHVSVGLTTSPKYDNKHKNIELEHSPISNQQQSYASRKGTVDKKNNYNSPKQGQMTQSDQAKVKQIADKAKAKAIKKSNKK